MEKPRKIVPPVYLLLCLVAVFLMDRFVPLWRFDGEPLALAGKLLALLGIAIILWPFFDFLRAKTGDVPFTEATTLVTGGLYRVTRNPMYLGMAAILLGAAFIRGSLGAMLPVPLFMMIIQARFILGEERFLEEAFGAEYLAYKNSVRRWL